MDLEPGYYSTTLTSQRCWPYIRDFAVAAGWNRTVVINPGLLAPFPRAPGYEIHIDYAHNAGLVVHTPPDTSAVFLVQEYYRSAQLLNGHSTLWYLDDAEGRAGTLTIVRGSGARTTPVKLFRDRLTEVPPG